MESIYKDKIELACAKLAHEAKNPISIISSILQLVEVQIPEVKKNKHWNSLYIELNNLTNLLNDFNNLNSIQNFDFQPLDLGEVLSDLVSRVEPVVAQRNVTLSFNLPDEIFNIDGNETNLKHAFGNLIKNAFEAAGLNGFIEITIYKEDNYIVVTVADNGNGISSEEMPFIFKPFSTFKQNGTGLGLAIVDAVINIHKGSVNVESTIGKGTKFTVKLPCK